MTDPDPAQKYARQADMLANKVKKRFKHLSKRFVKQSIEVFRLYDGDIPEIRAAVDWYAGHLVIAEYLRKQSEPDWLPAMAEAVARALDVSIENVYLKERRTGKQNGKRYERLAHTDQKIIVRERDLKFYVNPCDYVDTGLFADHRNTRQMVRELAAGKDFLNLYCYTGSFSCYAAKGGARTTTSVDRSKTAITWAGENMALNNITQENHSFIQAAAFSFLQRAAQEHQAFDLAVVDPPSFSTSKTGDPDFDIVKDHPLLLQDVLRVMRPGATIFFSTNHQNFEPYMDGLNLAEAKEITDLTIPEDYRNKTIHRCWRLLV